MSVSSEKGVGSLFSLSERIALAFEETARYLELAGESKFRIAAYHKAAAALRELDRDLWDIVKEGGLTDIPGIGKGMAYNIECYSKSGSVPLLQELKEQFPSGLLQISAISGLGVKKTLQLYRELDLKDLPELRNALLEHKVSELKGFTQKGEAKLLAEVDKALARVPTFLKDEREEWAGQLRDRLSRLSGLLAVYEVGALRRKLPEAAEIELLITCTDVVAISSLLRERLSSEGIEAKLEDKDMEGKIKLSLLSLHHPSGCPLRLWICPARFAAWGLVALTGPLKFVDYVRSELGQASLEGSDEYTLLQSVDLAHVLPEIRHRQELWRASRIDLVSVVSIHGNLHTHSTDSDGTCSFADMAAEAQRRGHGYLGISDHSRSLFVANGLSVERLQSQIEAVRSFDSHRGSFSLFSSSECDILEDGSLDFPSEVIDLLDYLIVAIHSHFHLDHQAMTERILKGLLGHAKVRILAHPTGRLIARREGYSADWDRIFTTCAAQDVAVEINAHPWRLDLSEELLDLALSKGCLISINTDAHSIDGFDVLTHGIDMARRAAIAPRRIINTWPADKLKEWFS